MIIETIVTTRNADGSDNIAPMGAVVVGDDWQDFELRPFVTAQTFLNLQRQECGVLHLTDDALLFAQAIAGHWTEWPELVSASRADCGRIVAACRGFEFRTLACQVNHGRAMMQCRTIAEHEGRPFRGVNRACNAVIEAAVLVSRAAFLPSATVQLQLEALQAVVERTGGARELAAWELLTAKQAELSNR